VADQNGHIPLTAYCASAFLLLYIDTPSDHELSDVASCSCGGTLGVHCTLDNPEPKTASTLCSSSKRRTDNASVTLNHAVLPPGSFDPSPVGACICSATFVMLLSNAVRSQKLIPSCVRRLGQHDCHTRFIRT
jgi:hypothetical protein